MLLEFFDHNYMQLFVIEKEKGVKTSQKTMQAQKQVCVGCGKRSLVNYGATVLSKCTNQNISEMYIIPHGGVNLEQFHLESLGLTFKNVCTKYLQVEILNPIYCFALL